MSEPFLGEIRIFAGNFAPTGWAFCQGQLMSIAQNTALFSLLGTTYGGDGRTTYALPDLRSRAPIHQGQGTGLTNRTIGEFGGAESVALTVNQLPAHNHAVSANANNADQRSPANTVYAKTNDDAYTSGTYDGAMNAGVINSSGGNQPHDNMPPYLALNFIIAVEGIFPSRS